MATEKLKFKLELYATMWDKPPHAEVLIDERSVCKQEIRGTEDKPDLIEFDHDLEEGKQYSLRIIRSNKSKRQTIINEKGDILKDQLLHIKNIEIDEINIGALVYEGVYTPEYPEPWASEQIKDGGELPKTIKNVTIMGHNGEWKFTFTSPFYMWLLENLY
tara:strand:- start:340 stop:822 length:483 start_codon:yes stop_codon:yes gene_type:complete